MRVAVVCPYAFDSHGGVQDQVNQIVGWLRADGHEAWAVAPGSGGPEGTRHVGRYRSVRANRSRAPIALSPLVMRRVAASVDDADVVHIHEPFMPMVSLGALLADTPPSVGTFHAAPGGLVRAAYRGGSWVLRRLASRLGSATAVSDVAASAVADIADVTVVPNGIDLDLFAGSGGARVDGRAVFVGRDDARKGLDVLLEAWEGVVAAHPSATLHVVGVEREGDTSSVTFLGRVSEADKRRELGAAQILAAPNRGGESFGIVVLEGLAAGCAVVASDLGAFRAVAGTAAEYVPIGDAASLSRSLAELLSSGGRVAELAAEGRVRARRFGRREVLDGYLAAYERAVAGV